MIPDASDEAVEAAALAIYEANGYDLSGFELHDYLPEARAALAAAAPHMTICMHDNTQGEIMNIQDAIDQIDAGTQVPSSPWVNTGLSDAVYWHEVREWLVALRDPK